MAIVWLRPIVSVMDRARLMFKARSKVGIIAKVRVSVKVKLGFALFSLFEL